MLCEYYEYVTILSWYSCLRYAFMQAEGLSHNDYITICIHAVSHYNNITRYTHAVSHNNYITICIHAIPYKNYVKVCIHAVSHNDYIKQYVFMHTVSHNNFITTCIKYFTIVLLRYALRSTQLYFIKYIVYRINKL